MADGRVEYEVRADNSYLESDLRQSREMVRQSSEQVTRDGANADSQRLQSRRDADQQMVRSSTDANDRITDANERMLREVARAEQEALAERQRREQEAERERERLIDEYEEKAKKSAEQVKKAVLAIGTAAVTASVTAVKQAAEAETAFAKVKTLLSEGVDTDAYYEAIKTASENTGVDFGSLSESVYSAISASVDENKAVEFTESAIKLAKGGFTDAATAVDVLTTALNAYGKSAEEAEHISDVLITTQNAGKTTVNELAASMGQTIPIANSANASIEDLSAQYAVLTKNGVGTAEAGTKIKAMLAELSSASGKSSKALLEISGKSFAQLQSEGKSTADILNMLDSYAKSSGQSVSDLFGSIEAGSAALTLIKDGGTDFNNILDQMNNSAGAAEKAYETMSDTLEEKFNKLKNKFTLAITEVGEELLPYAEKFAEYIDEHSEEIAEVIRDVGAAAGELTKALGEGIKFLWEHKEAVIAVATAYAAFKTSLAITSTINSVAKAINDLPNSLTTLTGALGRTKNNIADAFSTMGSSLSSFFSSTAGKATAVGAAVAAAAAMAIGSWKNFTELDKGVKAVRDSTDALKASIDDAVSSTEAENAVIRRKAAEYEALRSKTDRTAEEEEKLKALADDLQKSLGDEVEVIDKQTGAYNELSGSLEKYLEKKVRQKELEAQEKAAEEAYKQLEEIEKKRKEITEHRDDITNFFDLFDFTGGGRNNRWRENMLELNKLEKENQAVIDEWEATYNDFYGTVEDGTKTVGNYTNAVETNTEAVKNNAKSVGENQKSVSELVKSAKDLSAAFAEQNENGSLSAETILSLVDAGYAAALAIDAETGAVWLDVDAYRALAQAKLDAQKADLEAQKAAVDAKIATIRSSGSGAKEYAELTRQSNELGAQIAAVGSIDMGKVTSGTYGGRSSGSGSGSGGSSGLTEAEKEFDKGVKILNHRKKMGEIDDETYWNEYRGLAKNLPEGSDRKMTAEENIHDYENSLLKTGNQQFDAALEDLNFKHDMGEIDDETYWKEYTGLRDQYLEKDSKEWRAASVNIHKYDVSKNKKSSKSGGGNVISIDSYIPTIWDDEAAAAEKLSSGKNIEHAVRDSSGRVVSGMESLEAPAAEPSAAQSGSKQKQATLDDVVSAIKELEKADENHKISFDLDVIARGLVIGRVAAADIKDITKIEGKSPLE